MTRSKKVIKRCFILCPNPSIDILAHINPIKAKHTNRIQQERRFPGGKGIHVALALAEMNIPTTLIGLWGNKNSTWIIEACKEYQPQLEVIGVDVKGWNRSCYTFQSSDEWQDTELLGLGPSMEENHFLSLIQLFKQRRKEIASITVAGSWCQGAATDYNQRIVSLAKELNIDTFLDCTGEQLKNALKAKPFCIHLNRSEVSEFMEMDFEEAKGKISKRCEVVAITNGAKGLYLHTKGRKIHALAKVESVISTVGSGDCLMAGIVAGFYQEWALEKIAKLGASCGAANCIQTDLGMLRKKDVEQLWNKAEIKFL